jgi:hypothetical protein
MCRKCRTIQDSCACIHNSPYCTLYIPQFAKINPMIELTWLLQVAKQMHQVHYSPHWLCKGEVQWIVATGKSLAPFSLCKRHHVKCGEVYRPDNVGACAITWRKNNCELQDQSGLWAATPILSSAPHNQRLLSSGFSPASSVHRVFLSEKAAPCELQGLLRHRQYLWFRRLNQSWFLTHTALPRDTILWPALEKQPWLIVKLVGRIIVLALSETIPRGGGWINWKP